MLISDHDENYHDNKGDDKSDITHDENDEDDNSDDKDDLTHDDNGDDKGDLTFSGAV